MIPVFQDLETRYETRTGDYETKKKEIVSEYQYAESFPNIVVDYCRTHI